MVSRRAHEAAVLARAAVRARRRRRAAPAPGPGVPELEALCERLEDARIVFLPASRARWADTGIDLAPGDEVTTFAVGAATLARAFDIRIGPPLQLWFRAGGPVFRGTRATHGFTADRAGRLHIANYGPAGWSGPDGSRRVVKKDWDGLKGGMHVLVALGADLERLRGTDPLVDAELGRRAASATAPRKWRHAWEVGASEVFSAGVGHIACDCRADAAILQRDVDFALTDSTRLGWSWRIDELPSALPEDTLPTHDHLGVALEFDNGQDLTWQWSAELPVGHSYRCPFPAWRDRETHLVVRSGPAGLGRWVDEDRPVRADYAAAVGTPPERIVRVWLIAVSHVQRGRGRGAFAGIEIGDAERAVRLG